MHDGRPDAGSGSRRQRGYKHGSPATWSGPTYGNLQVRHTPYTMNASPPHTSWMNGRKRDAAQNYHVCLRHAIQHMRGWDGALLVLWKVASGSTITYTRVVITHIVKHTCVAQCKPYFAPSQGGASLSVLLARRARAIQVASPRTAGQKAQNKYHHARQDVWPLLHMRRSCAAKSYDC